MSGLCALFWQSSLSDVLRGRIGRLAWRDRLAGANLTPAEQRLIRDVVDRTRLWRHEKAELADELIAHFLDAREAGKNDALSRFGDPALAASLMRRAWRRKRPLAAKVLESWALAVGALLMAYLVLAGVFFSQGDIPSDYGAEFRLPQFEALALRFAPLVSDLRAHHPELFSRPPKGEDLRVEHLVGRPSLLDDLRREASFGGALDQAPDNPVSWNEWMALYESFSLFAVDFEASLRRREVAAASANLRAASQLLARLRHTGPFGQRGVRAQRLLVCANSRIRV